MLNSLYDTSVTKYLNYSCITPGETGSELKVGVKVKEAFLRSQILVTGCRFLVTI